MTSFPNSTRENFDAVLFEFDGVVTGDGEACIDFHRQTLARVGIDHVQHTDRAKSSAHS